MSELKTIDIKGKLYVQVHERVRHFNETYPDGKIVTELISDTKDPLVFIKATVTPDIGKPDRFFTGYSQAKWGEGYINKSSALENAETSAVGRALGFMGIGIVDALCTSDEIDKAKSQTVTEEDFIIITKEDEKKKLIADIKKLVSGYSDDKNIQTKLKSFIIFRYAPEGFECETISELPIDVIESIVKNFKNLKKAFEDAEGVK